MLRSSNVRELACLGLIGLIIGATKDIVMFEMQNILHYLSQDYLKLKVRHAEAHLCILFNPFILSQIINNMPIVNFNVGGKQFSISREHVAKSRKLSEMSKYHQDDEIVFVDHNYEAFSVVLDYLRYGRILVPPSIHPDGIELVFNDLQIPLSSSDRAALSLDRANTLCPTTDLPPQYSILESSSSMIHSQPSYVFGEKKDTSLDNSLASRLSVSVDQKLASLVISTIRPLITSQALLGAYHSTFLLVPNSVSNATIVSDFSSSKYKEIIGLDEEQEKFLIQPQVLEKFGKTLREDLKVPMTLVKRTISFRTENDFGILETKDYDALVIDFDLGQ
jgi:BTB/POZ domain